VDCEGNDYDCGGESSFSMVVMTVVMRSVAAENN